MTHVTCRLTAKNRDQLRNLTLGNRVWATFTFFYVGCKDSSTNAAKIIDTFKALDDRAASTRLIARTISAINSPAAGDARWPPPL